MKDDNNEIELIGSKINNESLNINNEDLDKTMENYDSGVGCFELKKFENIFMDSKNNKSTSSLSVDNSELESIYKDKNALKNYNKYNSNNNSTNNTSNNNFSININESTKEENRKIVGVELLKPKKKKRKNKNKKDKNENNQNEKAKNTNQGRKTKEESKTSTSKRNKFAKDNIFHKMKTYIFEFIINLINAKIKCVFKNQKYLIRKFNKEILRDVTIGFNIKLFKLKLRNLLNKNISDKYTTVNSNANKEILEKLEMNENFDKILNFTVKEAYEIFLSEDYEEIIIKEFEIDKCNIKFNNMKGVINKLRDEENEDDVYLRELEYYFLHIDLLMDENKIRKQRKEKLKLDD